MDVPTARDAHRLAASRAGIRNARQVEAAAEAEMAECVTAAKDAAVRKGAADQSAGYFSQQTAGELPVTGHGSSVTGRRGDFRRRKQPFGRVMAENGGQGKR
jgi:hypothetical protein